MIIVIVVLFFFIVIPAVIVSCFCKVYKKREIKRGRSSENNVETISSKKGKKHIISCFSSYIKDFLFLYSKLIGYIPFHCIRIFFYKNVLRMNIAKKVVIYSGLEVRCPWNVVIGSGSVIGDRVILDARFGITIGANVNISTGAWLWTLQHDVNDPLFSISGKGSEILIEDRAWISSRTTILPGCKIKKGCVVAAGAVLTKSCENEYEIYGGVPARKIGQRNCNLDYVFDGKHRHFI